MAFVYFIYEILAKRLQLFDFEKLVFELDLFYSSNMTGVLYKSVEISGKMKNS